MKSPNLIYDIGMHTGRDTEFYLKKGFNVIAVEANPALVAKCKEKFAAEIKSGQLVIIDKAISNSQDEIEFFVFKNKDDWGTINPDWNRSMDSNVVSIKVPTIGLSTLIEQYGVPYYMKIDIEGADIICLQSLLQQKEGPQYISVELLTPNNLGTQVDAMELLTHLKALGYTKFLISDQSKNHTLKAPQPALEGKYIDFKFNDTSSGLFGKELQGEWMGFDELSARYLNYFQSTGKPDSIFHPNGWFDVHAKTE